MRWIFVRSSGHGRLAVTGGVGQMVPGHSATDRPALPPSRRGTYTAPDSRLPASHCNDAGTRTTPLYDPCHIVQDACIDYPM